MHYATGGGATNAAISFKRLGLGVKLFVKIGKDVAGNFIMQDMTKAGIDMSAATIDPQISTAISFIVPSIEHNHVALCYRGTNTAITVQDFPANFLQAVDYLYIGPLSLRSVHLLPFLTTQAKSSKIPIACNPSMAQISHGKLPFFEALGSIDLLIVNAHEAAHLMRSLLKAKNQTAAHASPSPFYTAQECPSLMNYFMSDDDTVFTLRDYFTQLFTHGPSIAVVTNGVEGVYVATKDVIYFIQASKLRL